MKLLPTSNLAKKSAVVRPDKLLPTKTITDDLKIIQKSFNVSNKKEDIKDDETIDAKFSEVKVNLIKEIEKKVIKIDRLLKGFSSFKKSQNKKRTLTSQFDNFRRREKELEKKKPKEDKNTKSIIPTMPKLGMFGWLTNFISNVVLGFIFVRIIDHLPKLIALLPIINGAMDFAIDLGGKLLNGLVTFIDWGYAAYDNTIKIFKKFGGEDAAKNLENFLGKLKDIIQYSLIAGMLFSDIALIPKPEEPVGDVDVPETARPGNQPRVPRTRNAPTRFARNALIKTLGKGGAKNVLKFIRPFTKRLPIIGGLLDFGLSVAMGENPGRAAFKATGATILGAIGAAVGGPFAILTGLAGGLLGDQIGASLYDVFFSKKKVNNKPSNRQWFDPRGWFGMKGGGIASTRGGQYQSDAPRREIKSKKIKRRVVTKPAKLKQGIVSGGVKQLQRLFPEPQNIKSPSGTPSQTKEETMNPFGFLSHSYYRFASVPFIGPLLAMPLKVMLGDTIDSSYYTSIGQGFDSLLNKAYDEGAFSEDFKVESFDVEKIVSKSVEELATKEMSKIRSDLMQQLMMEKLKIQPGKPSDDCPCPEPGGGGDSSASYGSPEERALLDAISWAEGTSAPDGYRIMFGGNRFNAPPWVHPDSVQRGRSAAAGRYQFMPKTWNAVSKKIGLSDFSPINQDKGAIEKARERGVTGADLKREGLSRRLVDKLAWEWASFPTLSGGSAYPNQSVKPYSGVLSAYQASLSGGSKTALQQSTPSISPSSPAGSVSDCSCDDNIPDTRGLNTATNPEALGPVGKNGKMYLHWNAGSNDNPYGYERRYHSVFTGDGKKHQKTPYSQFRTPEGHTAYRNSLGVGLAVAAMKDYNWSYKPTLKQLNAMTQEAANLAKAWGWSSSMVNVRNVATHAEVGSMKDGIKNSPALWNLGAKSDPDNHGPTYWGGDGSRSDLHKLNPGDPDGSGGDKIRNMIKSKMGSAGKFSGGPVNEGLTKVHPGEYVVDKDSVDLFGIPFMEIINETENASQLKKSKQSLIQILEEIAPEYSENAADEIIYNFIYIPSQNTNVVQTRINNIQVSSNRSFGNPALDILSVG